MRIIQTYKHMFNMGFSINIMPPIINAKIIIILTNLKNPDLFVKSVVTEENIIKINTKK